MRTVSSLEGAHHRSDPWHEFAQVRFVAFQPVLESTSFLPLTCSVTFTVAAPYPA